MAMNILIAPNSLKKAANATDAANAIKRGLGKSIPDARLTCMPIADGGEHTLEILTGHMEGEIITCGTTGPTGNPIKASFGILPGHTAVIELSKASGYELLNGTDFNPLFTTTYGTGIMIRHALDHGCRKILLTLGGSATVDGGTGILEALGVKFLDRENQVLPKGGGNLLILDHLDTTEVDPRMEETEITLLCDVDNPLTGNRGAAMVFAPQKGAGPLETAVLDRCLTRLGWVLEERSGKQLTNMPGAGAAGGVAVGLSATFNIHLERGAEYLLDMLEADKKIAACDLVITADGTLDDQTLLGEGPAVLARRAGDAGKPVICLAGSVPLRSEHADSLFSAVFSLQNRPMNLDTSLEESLAQLENRAYEIGRMLMLRNL